MTEVKDSIYGNLYSPTTVSNQRFVDWFNGKEFDSFMWSTHDTGTGSADFDMTSDGLKMTSTDNGSAFLDWSPTDATKVRPFSQTGCVMIITHKLVEAQYSTTKPEFRTNHYSESGQYVGIGIQGTTNGSGSDNKIRLVTNSGGGNIDTGLASGVVHDWHTYKLKIVSGTSTLSVDGVLSGTGFASSSSNPNAPLAPAIYTSIAESTISGGAVSYTRYMECFNI